MAVVVRHRARGAAMTVIVQAAMIDVMIGRQMVVVAQQANPPMAITVNRGQPVLAILKAAVAQTVIVAQIVMPIQIVMPAQIVMPVQIVIAALKGAMIKPVQPAAASQHAAVNLLLVTS